MRKEPNVLNVAANRMSVGPSISAEVVEFLQNKDMSLSKIAQLTGLSKSYISRVKNRERSFTVATLSKLEDRLELPLPLLLLKATKLQSIPQKLRKSYRALQNAIDKLEQLG